MVAARRDDPREPLNVQSGFDGFDQKSHPGRAGKSFSCVNHCSLLKMWRLITAPEVVPYTLSILFLFRSGKEENIHKQFIGYVFQAFRLFRSLSALENILVALEISGCRGRQARETALRVLAAVGMVDKWRLKPSKTEWRRKATGGDRARAC